MKICFVTGKTVMFGNNVSHAINKTRRRFNANIQKASLYSAVLGKCSVKVTPRGLKTIEAKGGIDAFLENTRKIYGIEGKRLIQAYFKAKKTQENA